MFPAFQNFGLFPEGLGKPQLLGEQSGEKQCGGLGVPCSHLRPDTVASPERTFAGDRSHC